jgi:mRNA interferase MazF
MTSLKAGDIVWADFDTVLGTEQGGRRPAIVLTSADFHEQDQRSIVCPITRNSSPWPTKVFLPEGMRTRGAVLCDQIRNVHRVARGLSFIERAPDQVLTDVRAIVGSILGIGV